LYVHDVIVVGTWSVSRDTLSSLEDCFEVDDIIRRAMHGLSNDKQEGVDENTEDEIGSLSGEMRFNIKA
jgi:hypothetical protein